jgi:hypothetical protein
MSIFLNPIITEPDGTRKLRLSVDVGEFKPDEIVVKTAEKKLIVHAEHEEKLSGRTLHKEFNKEYELPESVDQSSITAYIGEEGKLFIEAPLKHVPQKRYSITQTHDVRKIVVTKESQVTITALVTMGKWVGFYFMVVTLNCVVRFSDLENNP